jgi:hypothetical protein
MHALCSFIIEQHRGQLRNPHKPGEGQRTRFTRLWPRFNYREPRRGKGRRP